MKRSIRAVTTGSGTEPSSSTAWWNARMLNLKLARSPTCSSLPSRLYLLCRSSHQLHSRRVSYSALPENSLFSMRRFVAPLELGELLLRASDVGLVRAAELK